jgi:hypothetical protein
MNQVEGISVSTANTKDFLYTTTKSASPDTPSRVSIVSNVDPAAADATTSQKTRTKTVPANSVHTPGSNPSPSKPSDPAPHNQKPEKPQEECFIAPEEGIYVPRGGNTGTITLTADRPVYWRTMSEAITTSDAGLDVPTEFPAYIVLESSFDPNVASNTISFHLHARETAPLGQFCPKNPLEQIGLEAYASPDRNAKKIFDIPMNINIVAKLGQ